MKSNDKASMMKKIFLSVLLVLVLVLQISFLSYLVKGLTNKSSGKNTLMDYTSKGDFDYKVYLKSNELLTDEEINSENAYILGLVDHISLTSIYRFNGTAKTSVTGKTALIARLKVYYRESTDANKNPKVLEKETTLKENAISFNETSYSDIQTADIYLDEYLEVLNKFQNEMKLSVSGYLEISSETNFDGLVAGVNYTGKFSNTVKIPLSSSVFSIDAKSAEKSGKVYANDLVKSNSTVKSYLVIANIAIFIVLMLLLRQLFLFTNKSAYERQINKILKTYDDVIVNTKTVIDVYNYKVIEIEQFKEILNLSRELLLPIINYEFEKNKETWFYVIKDNLLYRYIINAEELEESQNRKKRNKKGR